MIKALSQWTNNQSIWGIPLDIVAHFVVGICFFYLLLALKASRKQAILATIALALVKEIHDYFFVLESSIGLESAKDVLVTLSGPYLIMWAQTKIKQIKSQHLST